MTRETEAKLHKYIIGFSAIISVMVLIVYHFIITPGTNDDAWFAARLSEGTALEFLKDRYLGWSSRLVVEGILIYLTRMPLLVWRVLDILVYLWMAVSMGKLFGLGEEAGGIEIGVTKTANSLNSLNGKNKMGFLRKSAVLISIVLIMLFPVSLLNSAGWIATTLNYTWPMAAAIYCFLPLRYSLSGETMGKLQLLFTGLAALLATSQEQICAIVFCAYVAVILYALFGLHKDKKMLPAVWMVLVISLIALILTVACPGNAVRSLTETELRFPEFADLSFGEKFLSGYLRTGSFFMQGRFSLALLLLTILLLLLSFSEGARESRRSKAATLDLDNTVEKTWTSLWVARISALIAFIGALSGAAASTYISRYNPELRALPRLLQNDILPITGSAFYWNEIALQAVIITILFLALALALFLLMPTVSGGLLNVLILGAAFVSYLIIGFSPTIYMSYHRPAIPGCVLLSSLILIVYQRLWQENFDEETRENINGKMDGINKSVIIRFLGLGILLVCCLVSVKRYGIF